MRQIDGVVDSVLLRVKASRIDEGSLLFRKRIAAAIGHGFIRLVLDLGEVRQVDRRSAETFPVFRDSCRRKGGELAVLRANPEVRREIRSGDPKGKVQFFEDLEAARTFLLSS
ncbi:MAG TPA: STAS domain-containing protein [Spirochaetia bacterium]|nr:STAS domain-containing protein [Spirochaetia bacterium]